MTTTTHITIRPEDLHLDDALALGCHLYRCYCGDCGGDPVAFAAWLAEHSSFGLRDAGRLALLAGQYDALVDEGVVVACTVHALEAVGLADDEELDLADPDHLAWELLRIAPVPSEASAPQ